MKRLSTEPEDRKNVLERKKYLELCLFWCASQLELALGLPEIGTHVRYFLLSPWVIRGGFNNGLTGFPTPMRFYPHRTKFAHFDKLFFISGQSLSFHYRGKQLIYYKSSLCIEGMDQVRIDQEWSIYEWLLYLF